MQRAIDYTKSLCKKAAHSQEALLSLAVFVLPLIYTMESSTESIRLARYILLFALVGWVIASETLRKSFVKNLRTLGRPVILALSATSVLMAVSTAISQEQLAFRIFGLPVDYLGLLSWLIFIALGITVAHVVRTTINSPALLVALLLTLAMSLWSNSIYIRYGIRIGGVMLQATTMGMFAVLAGAISLYGLSRENLSRLYRRGYILCLLLATATLVLTQTRIGYVAFVFVLWWWSMEKLKGRIGAIAIVCLSMVTIAALPYISSGYFARFHLASVERGIHYRLDLYTVSGKDLLQNNLLLGNGSGTLPSSINNREAVPEEIAATLEQGHLFLSTHDLYIDFAHQFGVVAAIILVALSVTAVVRGVKARENQLLLLFLIMVLNALFNVPSLELTLLYFVFLFALLISRPSDEVDKKSRV